jgi:asparagine synthase (glutamine-hydrolysing)
MCGIVGYVNREATRLAERERVCRMADQVAHRGPDGSGFYVHDNVALGHRRLAILDLETGQQPMFSHDGRKAIVFNGEIYNYVELREELHRRGSVFHTTSDTEVLLEAYQVWGADCVSKFNGMWAFAIWDDHDKSLFCSRDRLGKKPLYYALTAEAFVFASEVKSLFAYGIPKTFDVELLDAFLSFTYIPAPWTGFRNILKLPPGQSMLFKNGSISMLPFWDLPMVPEEEKRRDAGRLIEEFMDLFRNAVQIRMRSDVPFGAFLSAGIDSAAVVSMMSQESSHPIRTCTMGFPLPALDERAGARIVAQRFHTSHIEREVSAEDAAATIEKLAWHYDEPFGDTSALPTYYISRLAREHVKMVLTGDGGDEVFAGYSIFQAEKLAHHLGRLPTWLAVAVPALIARCSRDIIHIRSGSHSDRLLRSISLARLAFGDRLLQKQVGIPAELRVALLSGIPCVRPAIDIVHELLGPVVGAQAMSQLQYWLTRYSLADDMLLKVDRASMAAGLETRAPFLDYRIVELLASAHWTVKMPFLLRKHLLKTAMRGNLPEMTLRRRKRGFNVPEGVLFKRGGVTFVRERARICGERGILNARALNAFLDTGGRSDSRFESHVWMLGMLSYCV